jgi:uncharacterized protein (UPF0210 family)
MKGTPRKTRARAIALWVTLCLATTGLLAVQLIPTTGLEGPDTRALEAGRRAALAIAGDRVRDFARRHGRYPERLSEAMPLDLRVQFRRTAEGHELSVLLPDGRTLTEHLR